MVSSRDPCDALSRHLLSGLLPGQVKRGGGQATEPAAQTAGHVHGGIRARSLPMAHRGAGQGAEKCRKTKLQNRYFDVRVRVHILGFSYSLPTLPLCRALSPERTQGNWLESKGS